MLERLDSIDWVTLTHAYGAATNVPPLLRTLLSPDPAERKRAIGDLFANIWHQGTVYAATAAAVPFLYELLTGPGVAGKRDIASLLSAIAVGRGYLEIHAVGKFGERAWRDILSKKGKTLEAELEREAAEIRSVRQAVSTGLPHLMPYLWDEDPWFRRCIADALGYYREHAAVTVPALLSALESEAVEKVRETMRQNLDRLSQPRSDHTCN
jgi:hypothetical protein